MSDPDSKRKRKYDHRLWINDLVCAYCKREFTAFSWKAKYCCPAHRSAAHRLRHQSLREQVLNRDKHTCQRCGKKPGDDLYHSQKMFVRTKPGCERTIENCVTLCSVCNCRLSRQLFKERFPEVRDRERHWDKTVKAKYPGCAA
jgi:5-methylcytosine-specific restriction endonuclease McrA